MIVIGITGSVGMGKSTAAQMLRDMGIPVHDSDAAVHDLLKANGRAVPAVGKKFPEALKTNAAGESYIDRQILGRSVFEDHRKKKALEEILHPMVWEESEAFMERMKKEKHRIVALDIPLLFETGWEKRVDVTLCVSASPDVQRRRVLERPNMTSEKFDRIVAGQLPDAEKRKRADYVVDTDKSLDDMREQLRQIVGKLKAKKKMIRAFGDYAR
ncbi:MAG: dephospho-CoA kinase [Pseudomonadota bacterium]